MHGGHPMGESRELFPYLTQDTEEEKTIRQLAPSQDAPPPGVCSALSNCLTSLSRAEHLELQVKTLRNEAIILKSLYQSSQVRLLRQRKLSSLDRQLSSQPATSTESQHAPADPRWDMDGFERWANMTKDGKYAVAFIRVDYLRRVAYSGGALQRRQAIPPDAKVYGMPSHESNIFMVSAPWLSSKEHDPRGSHLRHLIAILDRPAFSGGPPIASNSDVIFWYALSLHQRPRTPLQDDLHNRAMVEIFRVSTLCSIRHVVLTDIPPWVKDQSEYARPVFDKGWMMYEMILSAYCQQIVNNDEPTVKRGLNPDRLVDPKHLFRTLHFSYEPDRATCFRNLQEATAKMRSVAGDGEGFARFCVYAQIAWLSVKYIKELTARGGPFPRRQDLNMLDGRVFVGVPPGRIFVLSHCWEAEIHPSPSGSRLRRLVAVLSQLNQPASDSDYCFIGARSRSHESTPSCPCPPHRGGREHACALTGRVRRRSGLVSRAAPPTDYCSLHQGARTMSIDSYFKLNGGSATREYSQLWFTQCERTPVEHKCFRTALWEMNRLYAYAECDPMRSHAIPCDPMRSHAIPCDPQLVHPQLAPPRGGRPAGPASSPQRRE